MRKSYRLCGQRAYWCIIRISCNFYKVACLWRSWNCTLSMRNKSFNLDQSIQRQSCNCDYRQRRNMAWEECFINFAYGIEIRDILEKYSDPDDIIHNMTDALDNCTDIFEALPSLFFYTASHQLPSL